MTQPTLNEFIDSLAARTATPGGGAAAACSASMGTALFLMVVRFSRGKKANLDRDADLATVETSLLGSLERLKTMGDRDMAAFGLVAEAYKMPKESEADKALRGKAVEEAMHGAMVVPEEMICMVRDVFESVAGIRDCVGKNIVSDLGSGAGLLKTAADVAFLNVLINANYLKNRDLAEASLERVGGLRKQISEEVSQIRDLCDQLLA